MEKISQADIITTHLLYLANLDKMLDRERTYFHNDYFPFLKRLYKTIETEELLQPFNDPAVNTFIDEFSFSRNVSAIQLTLSRLPKEMVTVGIASGLSSFDNGKGVFWQLVQGQDYTVDQSRGVIALHTETNKDTILKSICAGDPYSLVVKYIPLAKSAYDVGEDGERKPEDPDVLTKEFRRGVSVSLVALVIDGSLLEYVPDTKDGGHTFGRFLYKVEKVSIAKGYTEYHAGHSYKLAHTRDYSIDTKTGRILFTVDNLQGIFNTLGIHETYSVFVEYTTKVIRPERMGRVE